MHFAAKVILMISIRQFGVSQCACIIILRCRPYRIKSQVFVSDSYSWCFFYLINRYSYDLVHEYAFFSQNEHFNGIYDNFPVCTMNLLNGCSKKYSYFVYL